MNIKGFDEFSKELENLKQKVEKIGGENKVTFEELFPDSFMTEYTQFQTIEAFFESGKFDIKSQEDFEALDEKDLDSHVVEFTDFNSWDEMVKASASEYLRNKLDF